MRLKTIYKAAFLISGLFLYTCIILYLYAGTKDKPSSTLLEQMAVVREKGMAGLEMEWLLRVAQGNKTNQQHSKNRILPLEDSDTQTENARPVRKFQVHEIYEELKFDNPPGGVWKQGFPIVCVKERWSKEPLEVYIVPHSHQDPGWTMTVEEYYTRETKPCLDSTLKTLLRRPEARFTYAEVVYFSMWVQSLSHVEKLQVKSLLESGRLEISTGGWVMTDEATADYHSMLDQLIEGHHWLMQTFGYLPNTSWSIDPFGQSTTMAYLLHKARSSGSVINRVHYEIKRYLASARALEFKWRQTWDHTGHSDLLTHMLPFFAYDIPHTCGPNPAVCCQFDFKLINSFGCPWKIPPKPITSFNVAERARTLGDQYCQKATLFNNSGILLVPLGGDFRYSTTAEWDTQLDNYGKLIAYWNTHPEEGIRARFATVSDYIAALRRRLGMSSSRTLLDANLPVLSGDLFTYADRDQDYWSGYFTSRPSQKQLVRVLESELRSAELLYTYARQVVASTSGLSHLVSIIDEYYPMLTEARRNMGLFQHHDGIAGTARDHVVQNYHSKLLTGLQNARTISSAAMATLLVTLVSHNEISLSHSIPMSSARLNNLLAELKQINDAHRIFSLEDNFPINELPEPQLIYSSSSDSVRTLYLFNPTFQQRTSSVVLHVQHDGTSLSAVQTVFASQQNRFVNRSLFVQAQRVSEPNSSRIRLFVDRLRIGPVTLEPLTFTSIHFIRNKDLSFNSSHVTTFEKLLPGFDDITLRSTEVELRFDGHTGLLKRFIDLHSGLHVDVSIDFVLYRTSAGSHHSGAYLFVPTESEEVMPMPLHPTIHVLRGPLTEEVTVYTPLVNHTVRLFKDGRAHSASVHIENTVNLSSHSNLELVMRIRSNISTPDRSFYTDSNCFQFINRTYYDKLPLQGNLYPMSCASFLEGDCTSCPPRTRIRLTLLTSYSLGVTSPASGELRVWLDRRSPQDDDRGLGQALTGRWLAQSQFLLIVELIEPPVVDTVRWIPRLTFSAQLALYDLLRPILRFSLENTLAHIMSPALTLLPPGTHLPCDYEVVNLKTFIAYGNTFSTFSTGSRIGLVVRRHPPFPHSLTNLIASCRNSTKNEHISIDSIFLPLGLREAAPTRRITMVVEPTELLHWKSSFSLDTMELAAFLLR